jgi:hypothetical protein
MGCLFKPFAGRARVQAWRRPVGFEKIKSLSEKPHATSDWHSPAMKKGAFYPTPLPDKTRLHRHRSAR